jgi:hypothetical protein
MKPIINLEETIGKQVGHRVAPANPLAAAAGQKEQARQWKRAFGSPHIPRGVYRFKSHEEADAWLTRMLTRTR